MANVLFLSTGNAARSLFAEALLRAHAGDQYFAYSAGVAPQEVNPVTLQLLADAGIDTQGLRSKPASEFVGKLAIAHLITLSPEAEENCPADWPNVAERMYWPIPDPMAVHGDEGRVAFSRVLDELDGRIVEWLSEQTTSSQKAGHSHA